MRPPLSPSDEALVDALSSRKPSELLPILCDRCESIGCRLPNRRARLLLAPEGKPAGERIARRLAEELPDLHVEVATLESSYYDGIRLLVDAETEPGQQINLGDVGVFDWMTKLTSNRRTRFVAAGFGLQLLPLLFYPPSQATALRT